MDYRTPQPGDDTDNGTDDKSGAMDGTIEWDPGTTQEILRDPTEAPSEGPAKSDTQKKTIIVVDSEKAWDVGTQTAFWAATAELGSFNMEKMSDPSAAVNLIQKGTEQRIITVLILGTQKTLLSEEIQEVIRTSTAKQIKTILLPTDTPQHTDVDALRQELRKKLTQRPRPIIIQAHNISIAMMDSIREEIQLEMRPANPNL